jgi:FkbH-like protein
MQNDSPRGIFRCEIEEAASRHDAAALVTASRNLVSISSKSADFMFCAAAIARVADQICDQLGARRLKTYVVRSVTVEPIFPLLTIEAVLSNYLLDLRVGGYGSYADELLNPSSQLAQSRPDLVLVILDLEDIAGDLPNMCATGKVASVENEIEESVTRMAHLLRGFRSANSAKLVLQGFVVPDLTSLGDVGDANLASSLPNAVQLLNQKLAELCRSIAECVFFDVDRLAARHGRARWRDPRMFFASRLPVSSELFRPYSHGLVRSFSTLFRAPHKVLCTDLDNTLWGGILGEDGPEGIATGTAYPGSCYLEYQKYLKQMSSRGILLAAVSKNNLDDVHEAFRVRAADLALKLEDFVAIRINWNDKAQSLRELAEELSLGLDAFVLVDDSPVECEAIRQHLPEVAVIEASVTEPWRIVEALAEQPFFDVALVSNDDVNRVGEYKAQALRAELAESVGSRDEFLASLGIMCTFQSAMLAPLSRSVQLLAKTNQFNLTTRRRSASEIEEFASAEGGQAVAVRVRDRFGDAGVVGLALARNRGKDCLIDSFLLSCRVIGRGIEAALLAHLGRHARQSGATRLVGEFIPTKKNAPCATFYSDHGFLPFVPSETAHSDVMFYELDLTSSSPASPGWITLEGNQTHEYSAGPVVSS